MVRELRRAGLHFRSRPLHPQAKVQDLDPENPDPSARTTAGPAAWELTIQYPAGKIEVLGASLGSVNRSGGYAAVSPATSAPYGCGGTATTKVVVVDPGQKSVWVDLVYRPRDFANCGRAESGDFTALGLPKAYDVDGTVMELLSSTSIITTPSPPGPRSTAATKPLLRSLIRRRAVLRRPVPPPDRTRCLAQASMKYSRFCMRRLLVHAAPVDAGVASSGGSQARGRAAREGPRRAAGCQ